MQHVRGIFAGVPGRLALALSGVMVALCLVAAPASAQDDGSGAYVGASTTVVADDSGVASQQITLGEPAAAAPSAAAPSAAAPSAAAPSAAPQRLPFTGGDAAQVALFGGLLLVGGLAVLAWRRRAATA